MIAARAGGPQARSLSPRESVLTRHVAGAVEGEAGGLGAVGENGLAFGDGLDRQLFGHEFAEARVNRSGPAWR